MDGTLIPIARVHDQKPYYCGKKLWTSPVRPGREHDITAPRQHGEILPPLTAWTDDGLRVLGDLGYEGEATTNRYSQRLNGFTRASTRARNWRWWTYSTDCRVREYPSNLDTWHPTPQRPGHDESHH